MFEGIFGKKPEESKQADSAADQYKLIQEAKLQEGQQAEETQPVETPVVGAESTISGNDLNSASTATENSQVLAEQVTEGVNPAQTEANQLGNAFVAPDQNQAQNTFSPAPEQASAGQFGSPTSEIAQSPVDVMMGETPVSGQTENSSVDNPSSPVDTFVGETPAPFGQEQTATNPIATASEDTVLSESPAPFGQETQVSQPDSSVPASTETNPFVSGFGAENPTQPELTPETTVETSPTSIENINPFDPSPTSADVSDSPDLGTYENSVMDSSVATAEAEDGNEVSSVDKSSEEGTQTEDFVSSVDDSEEEGATILESELSSTTKEYLKVIDEKIEEVDSERVEFNAKCEEKISKNKEIIEKLQKEIEEQEAKIMEKNEAADATIARYQDIAVTMKKKDIDPIVDFMRKVDEEKENSGKKKKKADSTEKKEPKEEKSEEENETEEL